MERTLLYVVIVLLIGALAGAIMLSVSSPQPPTFHGNTLTEQH